MMTVNAQGTLERSTVLTEANFKRIQPGMTITEVRRILGRNSKEQRWHDAERVDPQVQIQQRPRISIST